MELLPGVPTALKSRRLVTEGPGAPYEHCFFGVPPKNGLLPLGDVIPRETAAISFLGETTNEPALIRSFLASDSPARILRFEIGSSSYASGTNLDYRASVEALRGATLPALAHLVLGEWELFHNAATLYGTIGDVTDVLTNHPNLATLRLYGTFDLHQTLSFPQLTYLELWSSSSITDPEGDPILPTSFAHMLASTMPGVEHAVLHPHCEPARTCEAFPRAFLDGVSTPALSRLEIVGDYLDGEALAALLESPLLNRGGIDVVIEAVEDSPAVAEVRRRHVRRHDVEWPFEADWTLHRVRIKR